MPVSSRESRTWMGWLCCVRDKQIRFEQGCARATTRHREQGSDVAVLFAHRDISGRLGRLRCGRSEVRVGVSIFSFARIGCGESLWRTHGRFSRLTAPKPRGGPLEVMVPRSVD